MTQMFINLGKIWVPSSPTPRNLPLPLVLLPSGLSMFFLCFSGTQLPRSGSLQLCSPGVLHFNICSSCMHCALFYLFVALGVLWLHMNFLRGSRKPAASYVLLKLISSCSYLKPVQIWFLFKKRRSTSHFLQQNNEGCSIFFSQCFPRHQRSRAEFHMGVLGCCCSWCCPLVWVRNQ